MLVQLEKYLGTYLPARVPGFFFFSSNPFYVVFSLFVFSSMNATRVFLPSQHVAVRLVSRFRGEWSHASSFCKVTVADIAMPALHSLMHAPWLILNPCPYSFLLLLRIDVFWGAFLTECIKIKFSLVVVKEAHVKNNWMRERTKGCLSLVRLHGPARR